MPRPKVHTRTEPVNKARTAIAEAVGRAQEEHRLTNDEVINLLANEISSITHHEIRITRRTNADIEELGDGMREMLAQPFTSDPLEHECPSCGCPACDDPDCLEDECDRCTGEACVVHNHEPCECDCLDRHYHEGSTMSVDKKNPPSIYSHPSVEAMMEWFAYDHLPPHLQIVSKGIHAIAGVMMFSGEGPELTAGLRKLLEAKDCFVRAAIVKKRTLDKGRLETEDDAD